MVYLTSSGNVAADAARNSNETLASLSSSFLPLTPEAIEKLIQRTLADMRLTYQDSPEDDFKAAWMARLSPVPEERQLQLAKDVDQWQRWISHHIKVRVYNWRQVERIQLEMIQGLLNYMDRQLPDAIEKLKILDPQSSKRLNLQETAKGYLSDLAKICVQFMELVRADGSQYRAQLQSWLQSLLTGSESNRSSLELGITGLAPQTQQLYRQVMAQLEDRIASKLTAILRSAPEKIGLPAIESDSIISDRLMVPRSEVELLGTAQSLFLQVCKEMGMNPDDLECHMYHHSTVNFNDLKDLVPALAEGGGEIVRMIVANGEQLSQMEDTLIKLGLANTTTLVPGTSSLGTQVICEAANLNLPQIISTLWRPSGATLSLAERLRTRIDIEWEDASSLLNWKNNNVSMCEQNGASSDEALNTEQPETARVPTISPVFGLPEGGQFRVEN